MKDLLEEAGIIGENALIVADKDFMGEDNADFILKSALDYIMPLKRGSRFIKGKVPLSHGGYDSFFTYNGMPVLYKEIDTGGEENNEEDMDSRIILYYGAPELSDLVCSTEKSNTEIYEQYKLSQAIEVGFMTYNNYFIYLFIFFFGGGKKILAICRRMTRQWTDGFFSIIFSS